MPKMLDYETLMQELGHARYVLVRFNAAGGAGQALLNYDRLFSQEEAQQALEIFERTDIKHRYEIRPYADWKRDLE